MPIEIVANELKSSEVPINYAQVAGSGPPIVLLHWASGSRQRWQTHLEPLSAIGHLYAPKVGPGAGTLSLHRPRRRCRGAAE